MRYITGTSGFSLIIDIGDDMDIKLKVNESTVDAFLALPPEGRGPGVLVLHAWWGLNPFFKEVCVNLAEQGFVTLAPDLNNGQVAKTVDEAKVLMEKRDDQSTGDVVMAAKDFLLAHPACKNEKLGVVGFSMGGAWSIILAAYAPEEVAATVLFYGNGESNFSKIKSKVMGHFSDVDEWEPLEGVQQLEKALQIAGVETTFHYYPGKRHWFVESNRPEYDPAAAALAWKRTFDFLTANLTG
jgi:carboxymethylenebutenolidase